MDIQQVDQIIDNHHGGSSSLIQVLLEIQSEFHWLPREALSRVSDRLQVPLSRIHHIATFYKAFSLVPKGKHEVNVCTGTACHVRGASRILEKVEDVIGIKPGETDLELKFSLDAVNCVGCCALGPVMIIDGEYHGNVSSADTENVLKKYE